MSPATPLLALLQLLGLALVLLVSPAHAAGGEGSAVGFEAAGIDEPPLGDPPDAATAKARTDRLAHELRCPVCQALSVADSNSDTARAMYHRIEDFVAEGYTDEQIEDYFVDTYGEWVLLQPKASGANMVLWLLPAGVLLVGVAWIGLRTRGEDGEGEEAAQPAIASDPAVDPYREAVLAELKARSGEA